MRQQITLGASAATLAQSAASLRNVPGLHVADVPIEQIHAGSPFAGALYAHEALEAIGFRIGDREYRLHLVFSGQAGSVHYDVAVPVVGDAMKPTLHDGDYLLVARQDAILRNNDIACVRIVDDDIDEHMVVRRYFRTESWIVLVPDNSEYDLLIVVDEDTAPSLDQVSAHYPNRSFVLHSAERVVLMRAAAALTPVNVAPPATEANQEREKR